MATTITEIDALEYDTLQGEHPSLVLIDSTHFILAYAGDGNDGFIKTFSFDGNFDNITEIDSLEHDTLNGTFNSLVKIDSTHFILAYSGDGFDGFIKTFSIDGSADNITEIDSLEHDTALGQYNSLVLIDSTHFILAYRGGTTNGFIKTFSIDGSYDNITEIDSLEHDATDAVSNSLVKIDSTHFALAYAGTDNDGFIKTFSIDGSYSTITEIDSLEHDISNGGANSLVLVDSTHLILTYDGTSEGTAKTFSFDGSFDNIAEIDSLVFDGNPNQANSLIQIDSTNYLNSYIGESNDAYLVILTLDGSYNITSETPEEHQVTNGGTHTSLAKIDNTHYGLALEGDDSDGYLKTFEVLLAPPTTKIGNQTVFFGTHF